MLVSDAFQISLRRIFDVCPPYIGNLLFIYPIPAETSIFMKICLKSRLQSESSLSVPIAFCTGRIFSMTSVVLFVWFNGFSANFSTPILHLVEKH